MEDWKPPEPPDVIPIPKIISIPAPKFPNPENIINYAAQASGVGQDEDTDFGDGIEEEPETWIEPIAAFIWDLITTHGIKIVIFFCAYFLVSIILKKVYLSGLVTRLKTYFDYNGNLEEMHDLLTAEYELELWSEPEFCKKYLELYETFRHFRSMANRDEEGNSLIDDRRRQEEAKPLLQFFNLDYELHDRLIYAYDGIEWKGEDEDKFRNDVDLEVIK